MTAATTKHETETTGAPAGADGSPAARSVLPFLEKYALLVLFGLLVLFFSVYGPTSGTFTSPANLRNILGNESVIAVAALASIVPLTCGQFDLSVGSVIGLSAIATASASATHGWPVPVAVAIGVLCGGLVGLLNGWLVAYRGVNPLIATLGVSTLLAGVISLYTRDIIISTGIPESLTDLGSGTTFGLPRTLFALVLVALVVYYVLGHTPYGRYLASVGVSPTSARLVGVRVDRMVLSSFVVSGALSGVAGVLLLARAGTANPQVGPGFTLAALSAAFLGATAIKPGRFNVPGTLLGVLFVAVSVNGLVLAGAADWVQPTFNGSALLIAVVLATAIARRRAGRT